MWNAMQEEERSVILQIKSDFDWRKAMKGTFEVKIKHMGRFIFKT